MRKGWLAIGMLVPAMAHGAPMAMEDRDVSDDAYPALAGRREGWRIEIGAGPDTGSVVVADQSHLAFGLHGEVGLELGRYALAADLGWLSSAPAAERRAAVFARYGVTSNNVEVRTRRTHELVEVIRRDWFIELGVDGETETGNMRRGLSLGLGFADLVLGSAARPSSEVRMIRTSDAWGTHCEVDVAMTIAIGR